MPGRDMESLGVVGYWAGYGQEVLPVARPPWAPGLSQSEGLGFLIENLRKFCRRGHGFLN